MSSDPAAIALGTKFLSQTFSILVPSHPRIKFTKVTLARFSEWQPIAINADNNKYQDTRDKVWGEAAIDSLRASHQKMLEDQQAIEIFAELDGKVVGYGGIYVMNLEKGRASCGLVLNEEGRGIGLGKLTVSVLAQMCWDMGFQPGMGTMNANGPMRGVAKSLGLEEKDEHVEIPGRGVVCEVGFTFKKEEWKTVVTQVSFEED